MNSHLKEKLLMFEKLFFILSTHKNVLAFNHLISQNDIMFNTINM